MPKAGPGKVDSGATQLQLLRIQRVSSDLQRVQRYSVLELSRLLALEGRLCHTVTGQAAMLIGPFMRCPLCARGESISEAAANKLAWMIANSMKGWPKNDPLYAELENIRNQILNQLERQPTEATRPKPIDPLML